MMNHQIKCTLKLFWSLLFIQEWRLHTEKFHQNSLISMKDYFSCHFIDIIVCYERCLTLWSVWRHKLHIEANECNLKQWNLKWEERREVKLHEFISEFCLERVFYYGCSMLCPRAYSRLKLQRQERPKSINLMKWEIMANVEEYFSFLFYDDHQMMLIL